MCIFSGADRPEAYTLYAEDRAVPEKCAGGPLSQAAAIIN